MKKIIIALLIILGIQIALNSRGASTMESINNIGMPTGAKLSEQELNRWKKLVKNYWQVLKNHCTLCQTGLKTKYINTPHPELVYKLKKSVEQLEDIVKEIEHFLKKNGIEKTRRNELLQNIKRQFAIDFGIPGLMQKN